MLNSYCKALARAESMSDLKSHLDSTKFAEMEALSAEKQKQNWGFMKVFLIEATTRLEIVSERINRNTATLETKHCSEDKKGASKVKLVFEGGKWKTFIEESKVGFKKCE